MASRRVTIEFLGDDKSASRTARSVDGNVSKLGSTLKSVGKTAAFGLAAGLAVGAAALVSFGKSAVEQAREAQKIGAQTEAVIKSTGGAANVTAAQVGDLANAISLKAGIDDEAIQSGENMLLTFTNIRNEVGKGNDIFSQSTQIMTDMSVALGQDMKSSAMQLGKALNDPIAGVSALQRVGVAFTEQQKKQIETLVESGDTLGAQKLILRELNKEFAGSAAAQATAGDRAKVAWENFQEEIGQKLLPILDKLEIWFVEKVIPALERFSAWVQAKGIPAVQDFGRKFITALQPAIQWVRDNWPEIQATIGEVLRTIVANWRNFADIVLTIWRRWGDDIVRILGPILKGILSQIRNVMKIIRGVIDVVTGLIKGDWGQVWRGIKEILSGVWGSMVANLKTQLSVFKALIATGWDAVKSITKSAWGAILSAVRAGVSKVVGFAKSLPGRIKGAIGDLSHLLYNIGVDAIQGLIDGIESKAQDLIDKAQSLADKITGPLKDAMEIFSPSRVMHRIGAQITRGLTEGLMDSDEQKRMLSNVDALVDKAKSRFQSALDRLQSALQARQGIVSGVMGGFTQSIFGASNAEGNPLRGVTDIVGFAGQQLGLARHVNAAVHTLIKKGLSKSLIRQMLSQGEAGQAQLFSLASGASHFDLLELNNLNAERLKALHSAGMFAGNTLVGKRINQARNAVERARDRLKDAEAIADAIKRALKHSRIRLTLNKNGVGTLHFDDAGGGIVGGLDTGHGHGGRHANDRDIVVHNHIHIDGKKVQESLTRLKRRNGGAALGLA